MKCKGIPARARSGQAGYWSNADTPDETSDDHWINQYWHATEKRWVTIDVDGSLNLNRFDPYDIPEGRFDFAAPTWLEIRSGKLDPQRFLFANGTRGAIVLLCALFADFHSLMSSEIIYFHRPIYGIPKRFESLTSAELEQIDQLARLMCDPDKNFHDLCETWKTKREFRILTGSLL